MRPCRPITLPRSSWATWSRRTTVSSSSTRSTRTASGSSTSRRARYSSSSAKLRDVLRLQEPRDGVRGLSALAEPVLHPVLVELDQRGVVLRVVPADDLDELAVTRRARIGDHDAIHRVLLRPDARQPHACSQTYLRVLDRFLRLLDFVSLRVRCWDSPGAAPSPAARAPRSGIFPRLIPFISFSISLRASSSRF